MQDKIPFRPVKGTEATISVMPYQEGYVYFATDTKKIYIDANGQSKVPMGGNSGIYYGKMKLTEEPDSGQTEFTFDIYDLEKNQEANSLTIPNIDDLILNIPDGCFYRVTALEGKDEDTKIITEKLTIAGSGSGGGTGGSANIGSFEFDRITNQSATILYQQPYTIGFRINATDASGEQTGNGTYDLIVNGVNKIKNAVAKQGDNYVDVSSYLDIGQNTVKITASMDIGGASNITKSKSWTLTTTQLAVNWEYNETSINNTNENFTIDWSVSGVGLVKTTHIIIDDSYHITTSPTSSTTSQRYVIDTNKIVEYNLTHGSHKFEMYATAEVDGDEIKTNSVFKYIMFVATGDKTPIINVKVPSGTLMQYNTIQIPIIIYVPDNISNNATVILKENSVIRDTWTQVQNQVEKNWAYTPVISGAIPLTVQCGTAENTFVLEIQNVDIDIEEVPGAEFKFKASEFASNSAIQNWSNESGSANVSFSADFDWINSGLKTELDDEGRSRQYVQVKAGSQMFINYPIFGTNATAKGKTLKIIFKATNCRDYDAQVMYCKNDKKITSVNKEEEFLFIIDDNTVLQYSKTAVVSGDSVILSEPQSINYNLSEKDCRDALNNSYVQIEDKIYQCVISAVEDQENVYYASWYLAAAEDSFEGISLNAQSATYKTRNNSISTQYCEDSFIELELDISQFDSSGIKNYIKFWIDGVPTGFLVYGENDSFIDSKKNVLTIGSGQCDVNVYLIKLYEKGLTNEEHLQNFIADSTNAEEMIERYRRNDILDERGEISPRLLAQANPNCLVHVYNIPRMTMNKQDLIHNCSYEQYQGTTTPLTANNVTIGVQGTSSEKYVISAANIDSKFNNGFTNADGEHINGWSMDGGDAIPCNEFCTKVNVASCENANNPLNQEWYNLFQPYQSVLRCKNKSARDTMQFTNGVMFILDNNSNFSLNATDKKTNNLFGEISGYMNSKYAKMYSIANMGNSKKNTHVFHDTENPLECCIEVADNQTPQQWMVSDKYNIDDIGTKEKYFEFRYPNGIDEVREKETGSKMINGWNDFVKWMAKSNPQPKYEEHKATTEKEFKSFAFNQKTNSAVDTYKLLYDEFGNPQSYELVSAFDPNVNTYYIETQHIYGYTNLPLQQEVSYPAYTFTGFKTALKNEKGELWQKDYTPLIKGCTIDTYAGKYKFDTYEYRMAKMLSECEQHLIMDSVIYHYLMIEKHCMVDNVAKNTFWSTEDCQHWGLIKDYDNDTADGNDNEGRLSLTYGLEISDKQNSNKYVFNAHEAVWLNFVDGLQDACEYMYLKLEQQDKTYQGRSLNIWSKDDYLWLFNQWQSVIPERCWIEDYYRKYFRPHEIYNDDGFIRMLEGGKKTYQRKQFETYQDIYISSKYGGKITKNAFLLVRSNQDSSSSGSMKGYRLPVKTYSDCYIRMSVGSDESVQRVKRNTLAYFICPVATLNDATMNFYPANVFLEIGSTNLNEGNLGEMYPTQISTSSANKLLKLIVGREDTNPNTTLKSGFSINSNPLLETLYACNLSQYEGELNLNQCPNLKEVNAIGSTFTGVTIADGAPIETIKLDNPTALALSNLTHLKTLDLGYNRLSILNIDNIDQSEVNSKTLVENSPGLQNYKLNNIDWILSNSMDVNSDENTIKLLEKLRGISPLEDKTLISGYIPLASALTGNIEVTSTAYDGDNAITIYNKYVDDNVYPNLDINFTDKTYLITILNGDDTTYWKKRISINNSGIDADFLSDGPNGAFVETAITKPNALDTTYKFTNTWEIYNTEGNKIDTISGATPLYSKKITSDIILKPIFEGNTRYYTLHFYDSDEATSPFVTIDKAQYGHALSEYLPNSIPYKDSSKLSLKEAYDFQGYGLIKGATTPVAETTTITNNQNYYAIFKLVEDISTVVHLDWFKFSTKTSADLGTLPDGTLIEGGLQVTPKKELKGKITIPAEYNSQKVVSISGFNNCSELTHVFIEKKSNILHIANSAFQNLMKLKYFDFSQNTIQHIGQQAFYRCPLINTSISTSVKRIGAEAFRVAFCSDVKILELPASIQQIDEGAFAYLQTGTKATLQIGNEIEFSNLKLENSYFSNASSDPNIFWQNEANVFGIITWYSKYYDKDSKIKCRYLTQERNVTEFFGSLYGVNDSFTIVREGT